MQIIDHKTGQTGLLLLFDDILCWTRDKKVVEPLSLEQTWLYSTVVDVQVTNKPKEKKRGFFASKQEEKTPETRTIKSNALQIRTPTTSFELYTSSDTATEYFVSLWNNYVLRLLVCKRRCTGIGGLDQYLPARRRCCF
jgi:hypothetical protein